MNCDAVLIQQVIPGEGMERFLALTRERHGEYCRRNRILYQPTVERLRPDWGWYGWEKVLLIRDMLDEGYQNVIYLDVDTYIYDIWRDLREGCPADGVGAVVLDNPEIGGERHYNVGALYFGNSKRVREFVERWLSYAPAPNEQKYFNELAGDCVVELGNEWNYTYNRHFSYGDTVVNGYHGLERVKAYELMQVSLLSRAIQEIPEKMSRMFVEGEIDGSY